MTQPDLREHQPQHDQDSLTRFLLPHAGVRGVRVHLDATWQHIMERAGSHLDDPLQSTVIRLLGEASAAAALFTGHAKIDGRLSIQLRGDGPLRTLFAECTAAGTLRAIAQVDEDATSDVPLENVHASPLQALGANAILAITIEGEMIEGREPTRYQGIVGLEADSLAGAFEGYFRQSEQLPTRLLLAADSARSAGLMLQKLPGDEGDEDGWNRAMALFETLSPQELLDWPTDLVLGRLFHEEGAEVLNVRPLAFGCSCTRERVASMLHSLGQDEAEAAGAEGMAEIRCEFCGQHYHFDADQIAGIFKPEVPEAATTIRLQ
jgi:molecular chaperone Hsp33